MLDFAAERYELYFSVGFRKVKSAVRTATVIDKKAVTTLDIPSSESVETPANAASIVFGIPM
jgi:hypothetical protein